MKSNLLKYIRLLSITLVICFGLEQIAWAAPMYAQALSTPVVQIQAPSLADIINDPSELPIPWEHVALSETYQGSGNKLIIHIQDAHANHSGQKNMAAAMDELMQQYNISTVLVEGSSVDASLNHVRGKMPERDVDQAAKQLLYHGIIAGEEYLNLTTQHGMRLLGIEDQDLYDQNLRTYKSITQSRDQVLSYIHTIQKSLQRLKNQLYPKPLLQYESGHWAKRMRSGEDERDSVILRSAQQRRENPTVKLEALMSLLSAQKVSLTQYPQIQKLTQLQSKESNINFHQANQEQSHLIQSMNEMGLSDLTQDFIQQSAKASKSQSYKFVLLDTLLKKAEAYGLQTQIYADLLQYQAYLEEFDQLNINQIFTEMNMLETDVYKALLNTEDQKKLRQIDSYLNLLNKAYTVQMTTQEFETHKELSYELSSEELIAFLNRELAELGYFEDFIAYESIIKDTQTLITDFYTVVNQRDQAFIRNSAKHQSDESVSFVIAGGYHTEHLTQLWRDNHTSYIVLTPHITSETEHSHYENLLFANKQTIKQSPAIQSAATRMAQLSNAGITFRKNSRNLVNILAEAAASRMAGIDSNVKDWLDALEGYFKINKEDNADRAREVYLKSILRSIDLKINLPLGRSKLMLSSDDLHISIIDDLTLYAKPEMLGVEFDHALVPRVEHVLTAIALYLINRSDEKPITKEEFNLLAKFLKTYINPSKEIDMPLNIPSLFGLATKTFFHSDEAFAIVSSKLKNMAGDLKGSKVNPQIKSWVLRTVALNVYLHGAHRDSVSEDSDDDLIILDKNLKFLLSVRKQRWLSLEDKEAIDAAIARAMFHLVPLVNGALDVRTYYENQSGGITYRLRSQLKASLKELIIDNKAYIKRLATKYYSMRTKSDDALVGLRILFYKNSRNDSFEQKFLDMMIKIGKKKEDLKLSPDEFFLNPSVRNKTTWIQGLIVEFYKRAFNVGYEPNLQSRKQKFHTSFAKIVQGKARMAAPFIKEDSFKREFATRINGLLLQKGWLKAIGGELVDKVYERFDQGYEGLGNRFSQIHAESALEDFLDSVFGKIGKVLDKKGISSLEGNDEANARAIIGAFNAILHKRIVAKEDVGNKKWFIAPEQEEAPKKRRRKTKRVKIKKVVEKESRPSMDWKGKLYRSTIATLNSFFAPLKWTFTFLVWNWRALIKPAIFTMYIALMLFPDRPLEYMIGEQERVTIEEIEPVEFRVLTPVPINDQVSQGILRALKRTKNTEFLRYQSISSVVFTPLPDNQTQISTILARDALAIPEFNTHIIPNNRELTEDELDEIQTDLLGVSYLQHIDFKQAILKAIFLGSISAVILFPLIIFHLFRRNTADMIRMPSARPKVERLTADDPRRLDDDIASRMAENKRRVKVDAALDEIGAQAKDGLERELLKALGLGADDLTRYQTEYSYSESEIRDLFLAVPLARSQYVQEAYISHVNEFIQDQKAKPLAKGLGRFFEWYFGYGTIKYTQKTMDSLMNGAMKMIVDEDERLGGSFELNRQLIHDLEILELQAPIKRILIAEDENPIIEEYKRAFDPLVSQGELEVEYAKTAEEAYAMLERDPQKFQLIITDRSMRSTKPDPRFQSRGAKDENAQGDYLVLEARNTLKLKIPVIFISGEPHTAEALESFNNAIGMSKIILDPPIRIAISRLIRKSKSLATRMTDSDSSMRLVERDDVDDNFIWGLLPEQILQNRLQLEYPESLLIREDVGSWLGGQMVLDLGAGVNMKHIRHLLSYGLVTYHAINDDFLPEVTPDPFVHAIRFQEDWPIDEKSITYAMRNLALGVDVSQEIDASLWSGNLQADYEHIARELYRVTGEDAFVDIYFGEAGNPELRDAFLKQGFYVEDWEGVRLFLSKKPLSAILERVYSKINDSVQAKPLIDQLGSLIAPSVGEPSYGAGMMDLMEQLRQRAIDDIGRADDDAPTELRMVDFVAVEKRINKAEPNELDIARMTLAPDMHSFLMSSSEDDGVVEFRHQGARLAIVDDEGVQTFVIANLSLVNGIRNLWREGLLEVRSLVFD
ncbi:MAG: hypothetical protein ACI9CF_001639, partial [Candidatus Omnitrophota bacterium]